MKIFKYIQRTPSGQPCLHCIHFKNSPAHVEEVYPGLTTMSSGYASVRDQDGFCDQHQLYLSARDSCPQFKTRGS
jgi:hypothetical protein